MCNATDEKSSNIVTAHDNNKNKLKVRVLLDTGALKCYYISQMIARWLGGSLLREKATYKHNDRYKLVCSPVKNHVSTQLIVCAGC